MVRDRLERRPPSVLSRHPRYAEKSNEQLVELFQAGDRSALSVLVEKNYGIVWMYARRYAARLTSLSVEDLVAEGSLGIVRAAEKFDASRGLKFSTYAFNWILQ